MLARFSDFFPATNFFEDVFRDIGRSRETHDFALDIRTGDNDITIYADVPGMCKSDLQVTLQNGILTISGERKHQKNESVGNFVRTERVFGSFSRSIRIPENVDTNSIDASLKDGVLQVKLAKTKVSQAQKILVKDE